MTTWTDCLVACQQHWSQQEDAVAAHPYELQKWLEYLDSLDDELVTLLASSGNTTTTTSVAPKSSKNHHAVKQKEELVMVRDFVGRRAVQHLPRSYKLWKRQWEFVAKYSTEDDFRSCMEQALVTLYSFPAVWIVYLRFLLQQPGEYQKQTAMHGEKSPDVPNITTVRRTINRALQSLPVTQHESKLWQPVLLPSLLAADSFLPVETRACFLQRYCLLCPSFQLQYGGWCERNHLAIAAALSYVSLLSSTTTADSDEEYEIWQAFGNLCITHSKEMEAAGVRWEAMLRSNLPSNTAHGRSNKAARMVQQQGVVYTQLAAAWVSRGAFEMARSVYEEGLAAAASVRDFTIVYDAFLQLEEELLQASVESLERHGDSDSTTAAVEDEDKDDWDILLGTATATTTSPLADMELRMARAEHLTAQRPLLLNQVMLRQNPNHIAEWLNRAALQQPAQAAATLEEAVRTVHHANHGQWSQLVVQLADIYTNHLHDFDRARNFLSGLVLPTSDAGKHRPMKADDLAICWTTFIELELAQEQWDEALSLARQSVAPNSRRKGGPFLSNMTKNLRLWDLLLDLEESLGTVQSTRDAYSRALEIKAATVQHVLNFTTFLTQHAFFEESFSAYERGIELFSFPQAGAKLLWKAYLTAFLDRFKGQKVERTRDLFQRCLERCPAAECAAFYTMNGQFEEEYGLVKRALSVYREMCHKVTTKEKMTAYQLYVIKTTKYLGVTGTREIYQEAIEALEDQASSRICMEFAKMETGLQQIERARAILVYGAQMADPRRLPEYWKAFNDFEIANGNEETFREMLRVKRSVEASFSTVNYNASGMNEAVGQMSEAEAMRMIASEEGMDVDEAIAKTAVAGFVASSSKRTVAVANLDEVEERVVKLRKTVQQTGNVEEIDLDDDNDDMEEIDIDDIDAEIEEAAAQGAAAAVQEVSTRAVPAAVFGDLAQQVGTVSSISGGALERMRAAAVAGPDGR
jgi:pre-mRNA-splicing factor SYF1